LSVTVPQNPDGIMRFPATTLAPETDEIDADVLTVRSTPARPTTALMREAVDQETTSKWAYHSHKSNHVFGGVDRTNVAKQARGIKCVGKALARVQLLGDE
jgi:hypothetical protein